MIVAICGIVLMWLSLAVTLAMTVSAARPRQVLTLWPSAAAAKTNIAWDLIRNSDTLAQRRKALVLAAAAMSREPVSASAASALGSAAGLLGDTSHAKVAFAYAERLSRRDLQTQLWFIERSVQRGDTAGALRHYDIALRTTPSADPLLLPVLARASNDVLVRVPLIAMLRRRPSWRLRYLQTMLQSSLDPIAVADQIAHADLSPSSAEEGPILSNGLAQLVRAKEYRLAAAALPSALAHETIRNGSFEQTPILLPFDWWLSADSDLLAYRDPASFGDGAYVLRIATTNRGGPVARQLVTLPGNRFTLAGTVGNTGETGSASASLTVACADGHDPIAVAPLDVLPAKSRRFVLAFTVPDRNCPAQWITIAAPPGASMSGWIDGLRLQRMAATTD